MKNLITFEEFQRRHFTPEEIVLVEEEVDRKLALRNLRDLMKKVKVTSSNIDLPKVGSLNLSIEEIDQLTAATCKSTSLQFAPKQNQK